MSSELTAITYHYVHDLSDADFPGLKALDVRGFDGQLAHLAERHTFVTVEDLDAAMGGTRPLPERACAMTFDDGFRDHYRYVFPRLAERKIQGMFYAPLSVLTGEHVLRVHKIQILLATLQTDELLTRARRALKERGLDVEAEARAGYVHRSRFDDPETGFVKWLLSSFLTLPQSEQVAADLFAQIFPDESEVAGRLYLTVDEAREMHRAGMHFGGHGDRHYRLDEVDDVVEASEIEKSAEAVSRISGTDGVRTFAYPYGKYRTSTARRVADAGFHFAWGTKKGTSIADANARTGLMRFDTNDFPQPIPAS